LAIAVVALVSCKDDVHEVQLTREHHSRITLAGVSFATVFERDANEQSPLLVMLHGRGDTPEGFRYAWHNFPVKLQLSLPKWSADGGDANAAATALWPAMVALAHGRPLMIGGIDQGAAVASAMAALHPEAVACALPIAGREVTPEVYDAIVKQVRACMQPF
jgi:predicted esterase